MLRLGAVAVPESAAVLRAAGGVAVRVNPCVPGHAVVVPAREAVGRLSELSSDELAGFAQAVVGTQAAIAAECGGEGNPTPPTAYNIAIKDGLAAGAPFGQLHAHVCPRRPGDLKPDEIFTMIEGWSPREGEVHTPPKIEWPDDAVRQKRSNEVMFAEAARYAGVADDNELAGGPLPTERVPFGRFTLSPKQCFYASPSGRSVATVNVKPLLPGHVLVIPTRSAATLRELTADELLDLWTSVRVVQSIVQTAHSAEASELGVQDGADAGQSVPHVHVHIIPR